MIWVEATHRPLMVAYIADPTGRNFNIIYPALRDLIMIVASNHNPPIAPQDRADIVQSVVLFLLRGNHKRLQGYDSTKGSMYTFLYMRIRSILFNLNKLKANRHRKYETLYCDYFKDGE
jgi:hypothetical protein